MISEYYPIVEGVTKSQCNMAFFEKEDLLLGDRAVTSNQGRAKICVCEALAMAATDGDHYNEFILVFSDIVRNHK